MTKTLNFSMFFSIFSQDLQKIKTVTLTFCPPHTAHFQQLLFRGGKQPCHFTQGTIGEHHISRYAGACSQAFAQGAQLLVELRPIGEFFLFFSLEKMRPVLRKLLSLLSRS